jgi:hypothetical protein
VGADLAIVIATWSPHSWVPSLCPSALSVRAQLPVSWLC